MKKLLFSFGILILLFAVEGTASACVCAFLKDPTPEQVQERFNDELERAQAVFTGRVIYLDQFRLKFLIEEVYKGEIERELFMLTGATDNGDGTITTSSCDYEFRRFKKHLVYAQQTTQGLVTYQCSGTVLLTDAQERLQVLNRMIHQEKQR